MDLNNFYPLLTEKKILRSDTGIKARIYNAWKKDGILLEEKEEKQDSEIRKWEYLDVFEALWLFVVVELRKLNLNLNAIKEVRDFLLEISDLKSQISKMTEEEFQKKIIPNLPQFTLEQHGGTLSKEAYLKQISETTEKEKGLFLTNLGIVIYGVLIEKSYPSIIVELNDMKKKKFNMAIVNNSPSNDNLKEQIYNFYTEKSATSTFVNLPILPIVEKLFEEEKFEAHKLNYGLYTKQESQLLEAIRDNECSEVKVIKHQSGDITMTFSEQDDITGVKAKELRKLLGLKMYDKIEVAYRNDNHLVIKNIQKQIIKKQ